MTNGQALARRMEQLGFTAAGLSEQTHMDRDLIEDIKNDLYPVQNLEDYYLQVLGHVLMCSPEFFVDKAVRQKDLVHVCCSHSVEDNFAMARIQQMISQINWVKNILTEKGN